MKVKKERKKNKANSHHQLTLTLTLQPVSSLCPPLPDSVDDYHLLAELNTIAASRYATMTERSAAYLKFLEHVRTLHADLAPHLAQVDALEANTQRLHRLATHLDSYTEQLDAQFRRFFNA